MSSRVSKTLFLGLALALIGVLASFIDPVHRLEENAGLGLLFHLRGQKPPPPEVLIVSIDRESSERLGLPDNPDRWPRSLYARLVEILAKAGARVIVFDLYFVDSRSPTDDKMLAQAIDAARNVVLAEPLRAKDIPATNSAGVLTAEHRIVEIVKPLPAISRAAFASAPFVLPKVPIKVNQYWVFQTAAGESPTFPIVAFHLYALPAFDEFHRLLKTVDPNALQATAAQLPDDLESGTATRVIRSIRTVFQSRPAVPLLMRAQLQRSRLVQTDPAKAALVESLIGLYAGPDHRYLNYYGPPRSLRTIPFHQVLQPADSPGGLQPAEFEGKAIFVGLSEIALTERKDSFYTTFSRDDGVFLSGAEIAATAFSNVLQNTPVTPVDLPVLLALVIAWGFIIAGLGALSSTVAAGLAIGAASAVYLFAAVFRFEADGIWLPVAVPLFVQSPVGLACAVLCRYFETNKERRNIRKALSYYVPDEVVNHLAANIVDIRRDDQTFYGVCLFTDCAGYTGLSERVPPHELNDLMRKYFAAIFEPIKQNGGRVVDLKGDAVLAVWRGDQSDTCLRAQACSAALGIALAVRSFNDSSKDFTLPTRIAVHAGEMFFGNIGTPDHYEYGVMGDTVNTASRMDGLNKYLGTEILVSDAVIRNVEGFLTREAGTFLFKGKAQRIRVHELMSRADEAPEKQRNACAIFAEGLSAFRSHSWPRAKEKFEYSNELLQKDPLSGFYLHLFQKYEKQPPKEPWEGVVELEEK